MTGRKKKTGDVLTPYAVAQLLAAPGDVDGELTGASTATMITDLKAEGVTEEVISMATVAILPYLPGQEAPGVPSTEVP